MQVGMYEHCVYTHDKYVKKRNCTKGCLHNITFALVFELCGDYRGLAFNCCVVMAKFSADHGLLVD